MSVCLCVQDLFYYFVETSSLLQELCEEQNAAAAKFKVYLIVNLDFTGGIINYFQGKGPQNLFLCVSHEALLPPGGGATTAHLKCGIKRHGATNAINLTLNTLTMK